MAIRYRVLTLSGLALESADGAKRVLVGQRKRLALLALLAAEANHGVSRDRILALFWGESDSVRARNALNQLVYAIRRELDDDVILADQSGLSLNPDVVASDIGDFRAAAGRGDVPSMVALYHGSFLDGVFLRDAPEFERWIDDARHQVAGTYERVLDRAEHEAMSRRSFGDAVAFARLLADHDPLSNRWALRLIKALEAQGDVPAAIRHAELHTQRVRAELEANPGPDFEGHVARLRVATDRGSAPVTRDPAPTSAHERPTAPRQPVVASREVPTPRRKFTRQTIAGVAALLVLGAVAAAFWEKAAPKRPVLLVAPFENASGDSTLNAIGRVGAELLTERLAGGATVGVVDAEILTRTPAVIASADSIAALLPPLVKRTGATIVMKTRLERRGDSVDVLASLVDGHSGRVLRGLQPLRMSATNPSPVLVELASRAQGALASTLNDNLAATIGPDVPAPSFEAYKEYLQGIDYFTGRATGSFAYDSAFTHFLAAARLDTTFNVPLLWGALARGHIGFDFGFGHYFSGAIRDKDSVIDVLASRRARLAPLELHGLDFLLAERARDHETAARAAAEAAALAPSSIWTYVEGVWALDLGRPSEAVAAFRSLDVDRSWFAEWSAYWRDFAAALHYDGRYDEELAVARRGVSRKRDPFAIAALAYALGARGDADAIDRLADSLVAARPVGLAKAVIGAWLAGAAQEALAHDHPAAATQIADRCIRWINTDDSPDILLRRLHINKLVNCLYIARRWNDARVAASTMAHDTAIGREETIQLALIAAQQGDSAAMRQRIAEVRATIHQASDSIQGFWLDARLAALSGDAARTASILRRIPNRQDWHTFPELTPALRRSRAIRDLTAPDRN